MSIRFLLFVIVGGTLAGPLDAQCPDGTPPPCARPRARAVAAAPALSVAVLDFQNQSRDTSDAYLADGVAEEVASRLGRVQRLTVVSRTAVRRLQNASTMPTADLGRALNVSYLVTGSVRRAGNRVRIGVELLRATTGVQGWSDQYDRDQGDLLAMQDEIAAQVATEITGRLLPVESQALERRTRVKPVAYDAYLQGLAALRGREIEFDEALTWFHRAVAADSTFADAWGMIGMYYSLIHDIAGPGSDSFIVRAREAANRAVSLAPDGVVGHVALGFVLYRGGYDYAGAEREFRLALRLDPNSKDAYSGLATIYKRQGRFEESAATRLRAIALDPLDPTQPGEMAILMEFTRRFAEAESWNDRAGALAPADSGLVNYQRVEILTSMGHIDEAVAQARGHPDSRGPVVYGRIVALRLLDTAAIRAGVYAPRGDSAQHFATWEELARLAGMRALQRAASDSLRAVLARAPRIDTSAIAAPEGLLIMAGMLATTGDTVGADRFMGRAEQAGRGLNDVFRAASNRGSMVDILMQLGRTDAVLERLPRVLSEPGTTTAAQLRLDPLYAPLRGDPRFEAILAQHAN